MKNIYSISIDVQPPELVAGQPFDLTLNVFGPHSKTLVMKFDEVHTKLMHLIVVSEDLTEFMHLHPDYLGSGRFQLKGVTLPKPSNYVLFADFTPTGDHAQAIRLTVSTRDAQPSPAKLELSPREFTAGPLKIALDAPVNLSAGAESMLTFHISDAASDQPITNLDEYLGAAGHLVILDESAQVYLHTHPGTHEDSMAGMGGMSMAEATAAPAQYGPDVEFHTVFPASGRYALWLQIQYQGTVYTAPFTLDVTGDATPEATMSMSN